MAASPLSGRKTDHARPLTATEQQVLAAIKNHGSAVSIEEIAAETLLSPDVVVRAVALLIQFRYVQVLETDSSEAELELIPA
jgi:DNA-binding MarR family transcriptional regulator